MTLDPGFGILRGVGCATLTFTFAGVGVGDTVALGVPPSRMDAGPSLLYSAWVSAAHTIAIRVGNIMDTRVDTKSGAIRMDV